MFTFTVTVPSPNDSLLTMLLVAAVYFVLALYLDAVLPGEHGSPKHPLFCLRALCARRSAARETARAKRKSAAAASELSVPLLSPVDGERVPTVNALGDEGVIESEQSAATVPPPDGNGLSARMLSSMSCWELLPIPYPVCRHRDTHSQAPKGVSDGVPVSLPAVALAVA